MVPSATELIEPPSMHIRFIVKIMFYVTFLLGAFVSSIFMLTAVNCQFISGPREVLRRWLGHATSMSRKKINSRMDHWGVEWNPRRRSCLLIRFEDRVPYIWFKDVVAQQIKKEMRRSGKSELISRPPKLFRDIRTFDTRLDNLGGVSSVTYRDHLQDRFSPEQEHSPHKKSESSQSSEAGERRSREPSTHRRRIQVLSDDEENVVPGVVRAVDAVNTGTVASSGVVKGEAVDKSSSRVPWELELEFYGKEHFDNCKLTGHLNPSDFRECHCAVRHCVGRPDYARVLRSLEEEE